MHEYDTTLKLLLQRSAELAVRELTGTAVVKWLNVELPEIGGRRADLLGETSDHILIQIELQSQNDNRMALRMAEYCLAVYRLFRRFPQQIVVYVGENPLRMQTELVGPKLSFQYELIDIRELDAMGLMKSSQISDNIIAILARLRDEKGAVHEIVGKLSGLESDAREFYLRALLVLAGLRGLEEIVEEEVRNVPVLNEILEHKVLGREFKRGRQEEAVIMLRRLIEARFGSVPAWAEEHLVNRPAAELEELGVRVLKAQSLEALLKK